MEINPEVLIQRIYEETTVDQVPPERSPYLLEHVLAPYLRGEEIQIKDIDYAAFLPQEMGDFLSYVNHLAEENEKTLRLWEKLQQHKPLAEHTPSFC